MLKIIKLELEKLKDFNYYGSKKQIENERIILNMSGIEMKYNESIEEFYNRCLELKINN
jgi:hypothetical protein